MCFNPRTRTGCEAPYPSGQVTADMFQSTHPYRVRRLPVAISIPFYFSFNPRTRTGCDANRSALWKRHLQFQSTNPYRVRPTTPWWARLMASSFNPRTNTVTAEASLSKLLDFLSFKYTHPH